MLEGCPIRRRCAREAKVYRLDFCGSDNDLVFNIGILCRGSVTGEYFDGVVESVL
jgi:hypothetical protein